LLGLINNILDHSRLESHSVTLERIPFNLRQVVEGALDTVAAVAQRKNVEVCLISSYKTDPPGMMGDPFRVKQVVLNLLSNAVKFTPKGRVTVRWRHELALDNKVRVYLDVEDTGIGIPAQSWCSSAPSTGAHSSEMDKLFQSFSQIDESITRSFGGSGLGLIISKDLAKLLGGDCTAMSEYGRGSKFTFSFVADRNQEPPVKYDGFPIPK
jgi:signal transduction histidine kinase